MSVIAVTYVLPLYTKRQRLVVKTDKQMESFQIHNIVMGYIITMNIKTLEV